MSTADAPCSGFVRALLRQQGEIRQQLQEIGTVKLSPGQKRVRRELEAELATIPVAMHKATRRGLTESDVTSPP